MELIIISIKKRYELKIGKFGHYFYDKDISIDMSLEMVLNRLNISENTRIKQLRAIKVLNTELFDLKSKLKEVNKELEIFNLQSDKLG